MTVKLVDWGPRHDCYAHTWNILQSTWGDSPQRVEYDTDLTPEQRAWVERTVEGSVLNQVLERFSFTFLVEGVTRACTHQLVRTRIGCSVNQHGGRDNDWRHRGWVLPETIRRVVAAVDTSRRGQAMGELPADCIKPDVEISCLSDPAPLQYLCKTLGYGERVGQLQLATLITDTVARCKRLYAALVDAGVPYQDARRLLPIGLETFIYLTYTYPALQSTLSKRLEHIMDWEINCVAQLMVREVNIHCPPMFGRALESISDRTQRDAFAGLGTFPPTGKWPAEPAPRYQFRSSQNPFWILHPDSLAGTGPIVWLATNGIYIHPQETET